MIYGDPKLKEILISWARINYPDVNYWLRGVISPEGGIHTLCLVCNQIISKGFAGNSIHWLEIINQHAAEEFRKRNLLAFI